MINKDSLKRILDLAAEERELRSLIISLSGGFGQSKRRQAIDDLSHLLLELDKQLS